MSSQNNLDDLRVSLYIGQRTNPIRLGEVRWNEIITEPSQNYSLMGVFNEKGERIDDSVLSKKLQNVSRDVFEANLFELNISYPNGVINVMVGER